MPQAVLDHYSLGSPDSTEVGMTGRLLGAGALAILVGTLLATAPGCGGRRQAEQPAREYVPKVKIEIDPGANTIYWARWVQKPSVCIFLRSNRNDLPQMVL